MRKKNWWIWTIIGTIFMIVLLSVTNTKAKLIFLFLECLCYGIGVYKLAKGYD